MRKISKKERNAILEEMYEHPDLSTGKKAKSQFEVIKVLEDRIRTNVLLINALVGTFLTVSNFYFVHFMHQSNKQKEKVVYIFTSDSLISVPKIDSILLDLNKEKSDSTGMSPSK